MSPPPSSDGPAEQRDVTQARPNPAAAFHCGFSAIGKRCALGPTPSGQCCQDHWIVKCDNKACQTGCTKTEKCEVGQLKHIESGEDRQDHLPCLPIKNNWHSRNILAINLAILAGGILLACMLLPGNEKIFAPGELSRSHSQILGNTLEVARCSTCHPNSHASPLNIASSLDSLGNVTQEQLCMNCHQSHMPQALHGYPHDLSNEQFSKWVSVRQSAENSAMSRSAELENRSFGRSLSAERGPHWPGISTKCAQCHQEHHGDSRDLKAITDARCQSCHQSQFTSFSNGHPEFRQFPRTAQRRIAFDHQAHLEKHFPQNNASFDCQTCHQQNGNPASDIVRSVDYKQACASCHDAGLRASTTEGWAVLQLPSLNSTDIPIGGPNLVHWPSGATYGYDGPITLPMRMLLSSDPQVAEAIALFPEGDLSRHRPGDQLQQAAARTIASAVKQLLAETSHRGQAAWQERLSSLLNASLGRGPSESEQELIQSMVAGLPPDLFRQIEQQWFSASGDVASHPSPNIGFSLASSREFSNTDDDLLDSSSENLLDGEDIEELLRSSTTHGLEPTTQTDPLAENFQPRPTLNPHQSAPNRQAPTSKKANQFVGAELLSEGGWYLDTRLYTIRYMPRGHADPTLAAWIQFAALIDSARYDFNQANNAFHLAWQLPSWSSNAIAVGQCTECHLLPIPNGDAVSRGDWQPFQRQSERPFTRFDHRPHLTLAGSAECQYCHRMNDSLGSRYALVKQAFELESPGDRRQCLETSAAHFANEFQPIRKEQCSACHRAGAAPEGCTQCHNYHVDLRP